jgi:hypothetical protein
MNAKIDYQKMANDRVIKSIMELVQLNTQLYWKAIKSDKPQDALCFKKIVDSHTKLLDDLNNRFGE